MDNSENFVTGFGDIESTKVAEKALQQFMSAMAEERMLEAEAAVFEFISVVSKEENSALQVSIRERARKCETSLDWHGAENAYLQSLNIALSQNDHVYQYQAHSELSRLYAFLGRDESALMKSQKATESARCQDVLILLVDALEVQAWRALRTDDLNQVEKAVAEALDISESLANQGFRNLWCSRLLILRAQCLLRLKNLTASKINLDVAWGLLAPLSEARMFVRVQSGIALWWEATASLCAASSSTGDAVAAWQEAVKAWRHVSNLPQIVGPYTQRLLSDATWNLGLSLAVAGEESAAGRAFEQSQHIYKSLGLVRRS